MVNQEDQKDIFHLGITMAGAASAGCYTGGAMDYLIEILELWEQAKKGVLPEGWPKDILELTPAHQVVIDVMGGASAGGMTTMMTALSMLKGDHHPVTDTLHPELKKKNLFYDSWVLLGDATEGNDRRKILEKTLDTSDLEQSKKVQSLLNSSFIDAISEEVFLGNGSLEDFFKRKPGYISENLEVLLSHTVLRGIPLEVAFTTPIGQTRKSNQNPKHSTLEHFTISHFKLNRGIKPDPKKYLWLNPYDPLSQQTMKLAVKATGAFPIGLKFRKFDEEELTADYLKAVTERIVFGHFNEGKIDTDLQVEWPDSFPKTFPFISIDGGAINNEPFGEVLGILENQFGKKKAGEDYKYAVIMIDPFPDLYNGQEPYKSPDDLFTIAPAIIKTLWDQSKVKRAEMLDSYTNDYYRGEIFPVKWIKNPNYQQERREADENVPKPSTYIRYDYPICCDTAMAFGGFLDLQFRRHDFFLGRDNARNFYRFWFTLPCDPDANIYHPIHQEWTQDMREAFIIRREGKSFLPIIPDLHLLKDRIYNIRSNPYQHSLPERPVYDPKQLFNLQGCLHQRTQRILELAYDKLKKEKEKEKSPITNEWINTYYHQNWWSRISGWIGSKVLGIGFKWMKGKLSKRIALTAIVWVLKDLEKKGLLKEWDGN